MATEGRQPGLQHDLCTACRPLPFSLDRFDPLQETTDVDQDTSQFRPHRLNRVFYTLTRGKRRVSQIDNPRGSATAASGNACNPIGAEPRHYVAARVVAAQPLAGAKFRIIEKRHT